MPLAISCRTTARVVREGEDCEEVRSFRHGVISNTNGQIATCNSTSDLPSSLSPRQRLAPARNHDCSDQGASKTRLMYPTTRSKGPDRRCCVRVSRSSLSLVVSVQAPLSGHPGHLTPEQVQTLAQVRTPLSPSSMTPKRSITLSDAPPSLSQFKEELKVEGFYDPAKHDDAMLL